MISIGRYWLSVLILIGILWACKKDKVPAVPVPSEPTKWEKVAGHYKVYDTLGVYLYEMDLVHIHNSATNRDSIRWEGFDGEFTFVAEQSDFSNTNTPMYVRIGGRDTLFDSNNKRWKITSGFNYYYNNWHNDTIPLKFTKTNINYYIEDVTPYYSCNCKQIAVKQH